MDAAKALRRQMQINALVGAAKANALATGGCQVCFLPFDSERPSCNAPDCKTRWQQETAKRAAHQPKEGD